jgi:hypothetical protein
MTHKPAPLPPRSLDACSLYQKPALSAQPLLVPLSLVLAWTLSVDCFWPSPKNLKCVDPVTTVNDVAAIPPTPAPTS